MTALAPSMQARSPSHTSAEDEVSVPSAVSTPYHEFAPSEAGDDADMDEESEAARRMMAISALGHMKLGSPMPPASSSNPTSSSASTSQTAFSSAMSSPATSLADLQSYGLPSDQPELVDEHFLERVSHMPIVSGAIKGYERARNSNRVVRYGADLVESSVKTISRPVIGRVIGNQQLGHLDDFACRQLDRLGGPSSSPPTPLSTARAQPFEDDFARATHEAAAVDDPSASPPMLTRSGLRKRKGKGKAAAAEEMVDEPETEHIEVSDAGGAAVAMAQNQVAPRSRWQSLVIEAGGIGAAVSEESMKSMQYCLEWLHYATANLDHEIVVLRDFIASLGTTASDGAVVNASEAAQTLTKIKRDVVETIRRVVDVVSKYAGAALPEHAKRFVRQSILSLPAKWTQSVTQRSLAQQQRDQANGTTTTAATANGEATVNGATIPTPPPFTLAMRQTEEAAERVLAFAVESLDMLRGVTQIFGESVERAEAWLDRLRVVGMAQQRERETRRISDVALDEADEAQDRARPRPRLEGPAPMEVDAA